MVQTEMDCDLKKKSVAIFFQFFSYVLEKSLKSHRGLFPVSTLRAFCITHRKLRKKYLSSDSGVTSCL